MSVLEYSSFCRKYNFRDYPVVAGICLPDGLSLEDIELSAWRPPGVKTVEQDWIVVDSIDDLFKDNTQTRVFMDGRYSVDIYLPQRDFSFLHFSTAKSTEDFEIKNAEFAVASM